MLTLYLSLLETDAQRDKFEKIYTKYAGLMFHEAYAMSRDHYLAEDIVHETFLNLVRIIDDVRVENGKELTGFIRTVTRNKTVDYLRKRNRECPVSEEVLWMEKDDGKNDPETVLMDKQALERVKAQIANLNETYRAPLYLKMKGYKIEEIARILELTPANVKVRLHRARKMVLTSLEDKNEE